jgi:serine/threonine-protein kinase
MHILAHARKVSAAPAQNAGAPGAAKDPAVKVGAAKAVPGAAVPSKKRPVSFSFYSKRYQLRDVLPGGHAPVYKAVDRELGMEVVLKFLPPQMLRDRETVDDLKREAAVAMRLTHENIVRLYNVDLKNSKPFIVMEYIDGETLRKILQRVRAVSLGSMIGVARASVCALAYAHEHGIVHRDIKLENIMVTREGVLKVLDFGSALRTESKPGRYIEGTPGYMAPEQVAGGKLDGRADIFGLGTVLWELLTGRPAFPNRADLVHMYDKEPACGDLMEPGVEAVLRKAMARDPAERWGTVMEFGDMLSRAVGKVL